MKKTVTILTVLSICILTLSSGLFAADLSTEAKQFLSGYETVRAALATDDLAAAQKAAASLGKPGAAVVQSESLTKARSAFEVISAEAVKLAANQQGYHIMHCDMVNKDWVQTSNQVSNPYLGKEMSGCGVIVK